jgi:hypothetical protein
MFENVRMIEELRIGFDLGMLYLMAKPGPDFEENRADLSLKFKITGPTGAMRVVDVDVSEQVQAKVEAPGNQARGVKRVEYVNCLELAVPFADLDLTTGDDFKIHVSVMERNMEVERHPQERAIELSVPDETFELRNWIV